MRAIRSAQSRTLLMLLAGVSATLAACGRGATVWLPPTPSAGPPTYFELEPNDAPWQADFIGGVSAATHLFVQGHVQGPLGYDRVDRFEFVAQEPCEIELSLAGFGLFADLDLCIYDPELGQTIACFESPWNPELATVVVHEYNKPFQVVVYAPYLDSAYELELLAWPYALERSGAAAASGDGSRAAITVLPPGS